MRKFLMLSTAVLTLVSAGAMAADPVPNNPAPPAAAGEMGKHHQWTLEEARKHAHEWADKLDKMTPDEWAEHEKKRGEFFEKWNKMTPEEKENFRKERHEKKMHKQEGKNETPAAQAPKAPASGGQ